MPLNLNQGVSPGANQGSGNLNSPLDNSAEAGSLATTLNALPTGSGQVVPPNLSPDRNSPPLARANGSGAPRTGNFSQATAGSRISSALDAARPHSAFEDQVKQWAQIGPDTNQVHRTQAMERIISAHRHSATALDLGGLDLTSMPDLSGLNRLQSLYLGGNRLTELLTLPSSLRHLDVSDNSFSDLSSVPQGLRLLNMGNNPLFGSVPLYDEPIRRYRDLTRTTPADLLVESSDINDLIATGSRAFFCTAEVDDFEVSSNILFQATLSEWVNDSRITQANARIEAARRICVAKDNRAPELNLSGLNLGSLPKCFSSLNHLRELKVANCKLERIPILPASLYKLDASNNRLAFQLDLTNLSELKELYLHQAEIRDFSYVPVTVERLDLSDNHILHLPSKPVSMNCPSRHFIQVDVSNNAWDLLAISQITELASTTDVYFRDAEAATASAVSRAEMRSRGFVPRRLNFQPESDQGTDVDVSNNPQDPDAMLTEELDAHLDAIMQSNFANESFEVNSAPFLDDGSSHTNEDMVSSFMQWHQNSTPVLPDVKAQWEKIAGEPNASSFSGFLVELSKTEEYRNPASRPSMKKKVGEMMEELLKSPAFREKCFAVAMDASATCHDRIALSLNNMEMAKINHDAELGRYSKDELADLGRAMFRLELLNKIADRTIAEQEKKFADNPIAANKVDPIEIRLGFQAKLADIVKAPGLTKEMLYFASSNITPAEIDAAEAEILQLDSGNKYIGFLTQWTPWQKAMQRANKTAFTAIEANIEEDRDWLVFPMKVMNSSDYTAECSKQAEHTALVIERFITRMTWKFLDEKS